MPRPSLGLGAERMGECAVRSVTLGGARQLDHGRSHERMPEDEAAAVGVKRDESDAGRGVEQCERLLARRPDGLDVAGSLEHRHQQQSPCRCVERRDAGGEQGMQPPRERHDWRQRLGAPALRAGESARKLDQRERVPGRLAHEAVDHRRDQPQAMRAQELGRLGVVERSERELGHAGTVEEAVFVRPGRDDQRRPALRQTARDEAQDERARAVQPHDVVDGEQQRLRSGRLPHEGDRRVGDRHALDDRGVVEAERDREHLAAAWAESADGLAQREEELIEA
jgi:hypothetical protein